MPDFIAFNMDEPVECGDCGEIDFEMFVKGSLETPEGMLFKCKSCGALYPLIIEEVYDA